MQSRDKLNLRLAYQKGKLSNNKGEVTVRSVIKAGKKLPFLSGHFVHEFPEDELNEIAARDIIKNITNDQGERELFLHNGHYITFNEKYESREARSLQLFFYSMDKALRHAPTVEVAEALRVVIALANEAAPSPVIPQ